MLAAPPILLPDLAAPRAPAAGSVLLVNDTASLRRLKHRYLERAGYSVTEVVDGQIALEALRASVVPLVVVMNSRIPRLDAAGILHAVADEPQLQRHAFVLTTALARELPIELGALTASLQVPVLGKPFTEHELLEAVAGTVRRLNLVRIPPHDPGQDDHA